MRRDNYKLCTMHNLYSENRTAVPECYPESTRYFLYAESRKKLQGATTVITQRSIIESFFPPECRKLYVSAY